MVCSCWRSCCCDGACDACDSRRGEATAALRERETDKLLQRGGGFRVSRVNLSLGRSSPPEVPASASASVSFCLCRAAATSSGQRPPAEQCLEDHRLGADPGLHGLDSLRLWQSFLEAAPCAVEGRWLGLGDSCLVLDVDDE